jgi:hypothetical protein
VRFAQTADITAETNQAALFGKGRFARPPRFDLAMTGEACTSRRIGFGASIARRRKLARTLPGGQVWRRHLRRQVGSSTEEAAAGAGGDRARIGSVMAIG